MGRDIALLAFGSRVPAAEEAGRVLEATVANMRFVKPLDETLILELADRHRLLVTVEENAIAGGAGSAVSEVLAAHGLNVYCLHLGLPDLCLEQAGHEEQLRVCGLDAAGILYSVRMEMEHIDFCARDDAHVCPAVGAGQRQRLEQPTTAEKAVCDAS